MEGTDWTKILGKMPALGAPAVISDVCKAFYQASLKKKDGLVNDRNYDPENNPLANCETLDQSLHPKKGDDKYTFRGIKKSKDKETGIVIEEPADIPMKKFITLTVEVKLFIKFMLCALFKEAKDFYVSRKYKFPEEDKLMSELVAYSKTHSEYPVVPFIVKLPEIYGINRYIKGGYNSVEKKINDKVRQFFKGEDERTPDSCLGVITDHFVKVLNVFAYATAGVIFSSRRAINMALMSGFINIFNDLVGPKDALSTDTIMILEEYIKEHNLLPSLRKVRKTKMTKNLTKNLMKSLKRERKLLPRALLAKEDVLLGAKKKRNLKKMKEMSTKSAAL